MALGDQVPVTTLTTNFQATATFTCKVDGHVNTLGPGTVAPGTSYFNQTCPTCGTRWLVQVQVQQVGVVITQTS